MYTDHITPPIDTTADRLDEILAARGITPEQVNHNDGDPQSRSSLIRRAVLDNQQRIPRHYRQAVLTSPDVRAWIDQLVAGAGGRIVPAISTGPSLLLLGPTGVGKTYEAFGAIRELAVTGVQAKWVAATAADIYAALRPRPLVDSETEFKRFADAAVLVVDDLGAAKATEWTEEVNYRLINHRYEAEKPTLITSNVLPSQLGQALGDRVSSRLMEMCQRVVLRGADRRTAA